MFKTQIFANAVGRKKMAEALEVLPTAISNAVGRETFPPAWYYTCKKLADEAGIECPRDLFGQRPVHSSPMVNSLRNVNKSGNPDLLSSGVKQ